MMFNQYDLESVQNGPDDSVAAMKTPGPVPPEFNNPTHYSIGSTTQISAKNESSLSAHIRHIEEVLLKIDKIIARHPSPHHIDIVVRDGGKDYVYEGDFLKEAAK